MGNSMGGKCSTMTCAECAGKHKKCKTRTMGRWVRLQTSGRPPSPRSGHDVAVIGNKVRKNVVRWESYHRLTETLKLNVPLSPSLSLFPSSLVS